MVDSRAFVSCCVIYSLTHYSSVCLCVYRRLCCYCAFSLYFNMFMYIRMLKYYYMSLNLMYAYMYMYIYFLLLFFQDLEMAQLGFLRMDFLPLLILLVLSKFITMASGETFAMISLILTTMGLLCCATSWDTQEHPITPYH